MTGETEEIDFARVWIDVDTEDEIGPTITELAFDVEEIGEGDWVILEGRFDDPNTDDVYTVTVDWGDGVVDTYSFGPGVRELTDWHYYLDDGDSGASSHEYTARLVLADNSGSSEGTASVTVLNEVPYVDNSAWPTVATVGEVASVSAVFYDSGEDDTFAIDWSVLKNGRLYASGSDFAFVPDDMGVYLLTLAVTDDDGGIGRSTATFTVEDAFDIIKFRDLPAIGSSPDRFWYSCETSQPGLLTVDAVVDDDPYFMLTLYTEDGTQLAQHDRRIDWPVAAAGERYILHVAGTGREVHLRLANSVNHTGTEVTVAGTDAVDTFEFAPTGSYQVTINGIRYHFDDAEVESVSFDGGEGYDKVILDDSIGDDTLTAEATHAVFAPTRTTLPGMTRLSPSCDQKCSSWSPSVCGLPARWLPQRCASFARCGFSNT